MEDLVTKTHLRMCVAISWKLTRVVPWMADEAESEAYLALGLALHSWVKVRSVEPGSSLHDHLLNLFVRKCIYRAVMKLVLSLPQGYRTLEFRSIRADRTKLPYITPIADWRPLDRGDDSEPVGWELEYQDEMRHIGKNLVGRSRKLFVDRMTLAGMATIDDAAVVMGVKRDTIKDYQCRSYGVLREKLTGTTRRVG